MALQPELPDDRAQWLATISDARAGASAAAQLFLWSQLPFAVAVVGLVAWLLPRFPRLTITGGVFGVLGAFGHTVAGGWTLTQVVMADEPAHRDAYSQLIAAQEQSALIVPFLMIGVVGTVVGMLLLSIAHFRSHVHPRWVGPVLWGGSRWSSSAAASARGRRTCPGCCSLPVAVGSRPACSPRARTGVGFLR